MCLKARVALAGMSPSDFLQGQNYVHWALWIVRELGPDTYVNLTYSRGHRVSQDEPARQPREVEQAVDAFHAAGLIQFDREPRFVRPF